MADACILNMQCTKKHTQKGKLTVMSRETEVLRKIALLATGDEISQGDILNSNSQEIALRLVNEGMQVRMHAAAPDSIHEIEQAIRFLLGTHQALIITGGLGPTSDDLTRYAVSQVVDQPLVFDEKIWEDICARLKKFGYPVPPESNRQQALFPQGSIVIPNPNGTAAGCITRLGEQFIFMLPGPPSECLPMVDQVIIPTLIEAQFQQLSFRKKWLLFGVSEGKIAEEFDTLAKPFQCVTGYRLWHPYLEFKLHSNNQHDFDQLTAIMEKAVQPYLIGDGKQAASALLREKIAISQQVFFIADHATGGALEAAIKTPKTCSHLDFTVTKDNFPQIEIHGLAEYWQDQKDTVITEIEIHFTFKTTEETLTEQRIHVQIPFRGKRVIQYAVEFICDQIDKTLFIDATS
jgi:nicotinamide-nucleotide amidase